MDNFFFSHCKLNAAQILPIRHKQMAHSHYCNAKENNWTKSVHTIRGKMSPIKQNTWRKKWPRHNWERFETRPYNRVEVMVLYINLICFQTACYCKLGFSGDGKQCEAINVCLEVRAFDNCIKQTLLVVPNWFYVITQNITCINSNQICP